MREDVMDIGSAEEKLKELVGEATKVGKSLRNKAENRAAKFICKEDVFVQYGGHEVRTRDILDRAKEDYIGKGHEEKDIKEIQIYIKPGENAAYYVVNSTDTGKLSY